MVNKDDKRIMAVHRASLFGKDDSRFFEGYSPLSSFDYSRIVANEHFFHRRGDLEIDPAKKQPIPVLVVVNPHTKQVYAYRRSVDKAAYHESRLAGKWTLCVGGHIDEEDRYDGQKKKRLAGAEILEGAGNRELAEEIKMNGRVLKKRLAGFINYEGTPVDRVHFALVYTVLTDSTHVGPHEAEMMEGRMHNGGELRKLAESSRDENSGVVVENWGRITYENLEKIVGFHLD